MMAYMPLPLAEVWFAGLLMLGLAGCFLVGMCRGTKCSLGSAFLRMLGVAAVVAGVALLWSRSETHDEHADVVVDVPHDLDIEHDFSKGFQRGDSLSGGPFSLEPFDLGPFHDSTIEVEPTLPRWMIVSLGTVLIILGALLFSRERTRPGALKVVTLLGVGAILYSVATFFGDAPRPLPASNPDDVRIVRLDRVAPPEAHEGRARRPALRPVRPTADNPEPEALPERAGEIPVHAELARAQAAEAKAAAESAKKAAREMFERYKEVVARLNPGNDTQDNSADQTAPAGQQAEDELQETKLARKDQPAAVPSPAPVAAPTPAPVSAVARPEWVDARNRIVGSAYVMTAHSGLYVEIPECQHALDADMKRRVDDYIDRAFQKGAAQIVAIPLDYIRNNIQRDEYSEVVVSPAVGPMQQLHAKLEIDRATKDDLEQRWKSAVVEHRLWYTGGGALLVLALLGTFYGYLKLDMKTQGAQKTRLQLAATLVALIVAVGVLLARRAVHF